MTELVTATKTPQGIELLQPPVMCERIDQRGRWYVPIQDEESPLEWNKRDFKPSVTTIINQAVPKGPWFMKAIQNAPGHAPALIEWRKLATDGTMVHALVSQMIRGLTIDLVTPWLDDETGEYIPIGARHVKRLIGFKHWWDKYKPKVLASEIMLYHPDIAWAGTADLICEIGGKTWLIDVKTGKENYPDMMRQLTAYRILAETCFDMKIECVSPLLLPDGWRKIDGSYTFYAKKYQPDEDAWHRTFYHWQDLAGDPPSEPEPLPTTMTLYEKEKDDSQTDRT